MARRYRRARRHSKRSFTIPIAFMAGLAAGLATPVDLAFQGRYKDAMVQLCRDFTGYNYYSDIWDIKSAKALAPLLIGFGVHWIASRIGINRALGRVRIPFIRI